MMIKFRKNQNNELQTQKMNVEATFTLNPQLGCDLFSLRGNELCLRPDVCETEKQKLKKSKWKSRANCCPAREHEYQTCSTYHNGLFNRGTVDSTCRPTLCETCKNYIRSHTYFNDRWCTSCRRCHHLCASHRTSTIGCSPMKVKANTSCEPIRVCSRPLPLHITSCRDSLPPPMMHTNTSDKSFIRVGNMPAGNSQFTSISVLLCKMWYQLVGSLVWHLTASTVISVLVTLCWIMAHTQMVVAHAIEAPVTSSPSSSLKDLYGSTVPIMKFTTEATITTTTTTATKTTTTRTTEATTRIIGTTATTGIETTAAAMAATNVALATTTFTPTLLQHQRATTAMATRYNRGKYIKTGSQAKKRVNNLSPSWSSSTSDDVSSIIDKFQMNTTEMIFLNDISSATSSFSPSSPTYNYTTTFISGDNHDMPRGTQSAINADNDIALFNSIHGIPLNNSLAQAGNGSITGDGSSDGTTDAGLALDDISSEDASDYVFDRTDVRIIFITLYTLVFCCCFFGNLLVILVVTLSRRLRSITNFFLANLALADFCVGLFCVMQNLSIYLIDSWVFGEFLCRMYQFVHSLSYTASIFILVVICMERYFAIVHPITCKQILTAARLRMVILTVWITSAVYSTPKFVFSKTIKNVHTESGQEEEICVLDRKMFNSKLLDMINFVLLYVIPLLVMTVLYSKIAIALWRSSRGLTHHLAQQHDNSMSLHNSMYHHHQPTNHLHNNQQHHPHQHHLHHPHHHHNQVQQQNTTAAGASHAANTCPMGSGGSAATLSRKQSSKYEKRGISKTESQVSLDSDRPVVSTCRKSSFHQHNHLGHHHGPQMAQPATSNHNHRTHLHQNPSASGGGGGGAAATGSGPLPGSQRVSHYSHSSNNVLRARRGVVRMLIIFVLTFALCNLPYHARKMWQYWSRSYRGDSNFNALLTPLTFLVSYFNSGINPLLYAFLSRNFRKGMRELLMCSWRKSKTKSSTNSSMHHKRTTLQNHSLPTDTTHIGNEQL